MKGLEDIHISVEVSTIINSRSGRGDYHFGRMWIIWKDKNGKKHTRHFKVNSKQMLRAVTIQARLLDSAPEI